MASMTESERHLAQPDKDGDIEAWYMDNSSEDQRLPHRQEPNKPCSMRTLSELGVLYWKLDADNYEHDDRLAAICKVRNYSHKEIITMSKDALPGYDEKMKMFYREHIHEDEEIRYILDGMGYFDVRDLQDRWIRIQCCKGDLIVLPEGIYHRFTLDNRDYAKLMRLFQGEPVWTPQNRPQEDNASRQKYLRGVGDGQTAAAV